MAVRASYSCKKCFFQCDTDAELSRHQCTQKESVRCGHCENNYSFDDIDNHECSPAKMEKSIDNINPDHYKTNGMECIDISKFYCFRLGNVIKYIWRAGLKSNSSELEDLKKARWYLDHKIRELENGITKK